MVQEGNPNSVTDAGMGALCACTAVKGAFLNVKINGSGLDDKVYVKKMLEEGRIIEDDAERAEHEIMDILKQRIG